MSGQNIYQTIPLVGQQPGVQINHAVDRTDRLLQEVGDQTFATVLKASRGRIDQPMRVAADKLKRYLGEARSLRESELNSTYLQVVDAFTTGAAAAVVMRLASAQAVNSYIVVKHGDSDVFTLSEDQPTGTDWFLQIKIADCIDEGVYVQLEKGKTDNEICLKIRERKFNSKGREVATGDILYEITGSTDVNAVDDFEQSYYLGNVAEKYYGDWLSVEANQQANKILSTDSYASQIVGQGIVPFVDPTGDITNEIYLAAADKIKKTSLQYRYIMTDSSNLALVDALYKTAVYNNRKIIAAIPGNLNPEAAIRWKEQFEWDNQESMYIDWVWTPVKRQDPTFKNGVVLLASVGQKVGYSCARNGNLNGYGLPPLQQPIAGSDYMVVGTRFKQIYQPEIVEIADLAEARINPCVYEQYHNASGYVWADSLSGTQKTGISKLSSVTEITIWLQDYFGRYSKSHLQKPMEERIRKQREELEKVLNWAEASGWLIKSASLGGVAYTYSVQRNERYPDDRMDWTINIGIEGVVRQVVGNTNMYSSD